MTNKVKYPIEAFGLAMVIFTTSIQTAAIMAVALVVVDLVISMLQGKLGNKVCAAISAIAAYVLVIVIGNINDLGLSYSLIAPAFALGVLSGKHYYFDEAEESIPAVVMAGAGMVILGVVRQLLSNGSSSFVSNAYGKAMFGLILAGMVIALVNKINKTNGNTQAGLWVCFAAIICEAPFVLDAFGEIGGMIAGMAVVAVMYYTFRTKLVFSNAEETTQGLPLEMALLGMIYMIVTIL